MKMTLVLPEQHLVFFNYEEKIPEERYEIIKQDESGFVVENKYGDVLYISNLRLEHRPFRIEYDE